MADDRIRWNAPTKPRLSAKRVTVVRFMALGGAIALTVYDAYVSHGGFMKLGLPDLAPLVLATFIFIVQLAAGVIQQLGMDPFKGVGGSKPLDFLWLATLWGMYAIDIGSNAVEYGIGNHLNGAAITSRPLDALSMSLLIVVLAGIIALGDEVLLRLMDRMAVGAKKNALASRKLAIEEEAYREYLEGYKASLAASARTAGERGADGIEWLSEEGAK